MIYRVLPYYTRKTVLEIRPPAQAKDEYFLFLRVNPFLVFPVHLCAGFTVGIKRNLILQNTVCL